MTSAVRCRTRATPDSPTNMWCASSVSMNFVVRASGSNPDSASAHELELAVAIGEVREHEEREPVGRPLVEGAEDARIVGVARAALEQRVGFLAAVASEIAMQQVHHRPQVAAFLDVHLEEVAQVVQRRAVQAEMALLLDRRGLGVALRDDDAAQVRAMLARHVLPCGLARCARRSGSCDRQTGGARKMPQR